MLHTLAVIQARPATFQMPTSTATAGDAITPVDLNAAIVTRRGTVKSPADRDRGSASRRFGNQSLLEWVVRRVGECLSVHRMVVLADHPDDEPAIRRILPSNVPVFSSDKPDPLARLAELVEHFQPASVLRVCAHSPFVDPALMDRLVATGNEHPSCDYISYSSRNGQPAVLSSVGLFAEWLRADAIARANLAATAASDREQVTHFIYSHPELFTLRLISSPVEVDRDDVRLTLANEQDWEHAHAIYDALGPESLDWQRIARLLDHQPRLRARMAELNQKNVAQGA
jgi:spore coat polysaccharide biosynthesis protein SpsF